MGIYVRLKSYPEAALPRSRLEYAYEVIEYYQRAQMFYPERIEIWLHAPSKNLGGEPRKPIIVSEARITPAYRELISRTFSRLLPADQFDSIVIVRGVWVFGKLRLGGYFSVNNAPEWRATYCDVEIEAYPKKGVGDLIDIIWQDYDPEGLIPDFTIELRHAENEGARLDRVFFSYGVPSKDLTSIRALSAQDDKELIWFLYKTLESKEEAEQRRHLNTRFLVRALQGSEKADTTLREGMKEATIIVKKAGSVAIIAKEKNSFKKLYELFNQVIFKPVLSGLPNDEYYRKLILKGLGEGS